MYARFSRPLAVATACISAKTFANCDSHPDLLPHGSLSSMEGYMFHSIKEKLSKIQDMHSAVKASRDAHPGTTGIFWNFKTKRAEPGRMWLTPDQMPPDVKAALSRPYSKSEMEHARVLSSIDVVAPVPQGQKPKLLLMMGPPGAGKSSLLPHASKLLDLDLDTFVNVDGDDCRTAHGGWNDVIETGSAHKAYGYEGAMDYAKRNGGHVNRLKDQLRIEAMHDRKNLMFGLVKSDKVRCLMELPEIDDYEIVVFGLMVDFEECMDRNLNRMQENGRRSNFEKTQWLSVMDDMVMMVGESYSHRALVMDNTNFGHPKILYSRTTRLNDLADVVAQWKTH